MLPNASRAIVELLSKVRDYLLSPSHPIGRFKSAVFFPLGYTQQDWEQLRVDLLAHATTGEALPGESSRYGQKYTVCALREPLSVATNPLDGHRRPTPASIRHADLHHESTRARACASPSGSLMKQRH